MLEKIDHKDAARIGGLIITAVLAERSAAMDYPPAAQPTPSTTLEDQIMNPKFPKNEREWWASREIGRLRLIEAAAKNVSDTLEGGFIVCQRCGEQETTSDVDFAAELRAALNR